MTPALDRKLYMGTDIASFYIYHPDDLAHRVTSPLGWQSCGFASRKEFEAGRLIGWCTGSDGSFGFRITDGPLSHREELYHACGWEFRLRVVHDRVIIDNGDQIPNADFPPDSIEPDDQRWIALPNGEYRVSIHAIEWYGEPGATNEDGEATENSLQNYVIQFERIGDISSVAVRSSSPPRLECTRGYEPREFDCSTADAHVADLSLLISESIAVIYVRDWLIVPGFTNSLTVSDDVYNSVFGPRPLRTNPERRFILSEAAARPGDFGVLARATGASRNGNEPCRMHFLALRLVRLADCAASEDLTRSRAEAVDRSTTVADAAELDSLKQIFSEFVRRDSSFRTRRPTADFIAEEVASMTSAESITDTLLHHLPLSAEDRLAVLLMSDAKRVRSLNRAFSEKIK